MSESETLPRVPGIKVPEVVARLRISWEELRERLLTFVREHGQSLRALRGALDAGDVSEARRLSVELGIAGANFGADKLWENARALEAALRTGDRFFEHLYDEVEMEFSGLVKGIERMNDGFPSREIGDVIASLYDFSALRRALSDLQMALRGRAWDAADAALKAVRDEGIPPDMLEGFRELEKLVRDRAADDALDMAGILKQNLDQ